MKQLNIITVGKSSKSSGHYMYRTVVTICTTSLTFTNSTFCPHSVFTCFVLISEQTAIISLYNINPLKPELNSIYYLLALLAHHFLHVSSIRVKSLTFRRLMSYIYIYGAPILDVSRSHTTTQHSR